MKQVVVTVSPIGDVKIDALGFKGKGCADATAQIELVLGGGAQSSDKKKKPDFFAVNSSGNQTKHKA